MKVLKFGGTSVGSAKNIQKVIEIVSSQSKSNNIAVVVSAVGGVTDKLLEAANKAANKDASYIDELNAIKKLHLNVINNLIKNESLALVKSVINKQLARLEKLLEGIYLINELSPSAASNACAITLPNRFFLNM